MSDEMRHIGSSLERFRREIGMDDPRRVLELERAWPALVGEQLAQHSRPVAIKDDVLVVEVDDGAWAAPLRYLSDDVVRRVGGGVTRLHTRARRAGRGRS